MYKDKEKQKQANKERQQRYRDKAKSVTPAVTPCDENVTPTIPDDWVGYGLPNCACMHCQQNRRSGSRLLINHGPYKNEHELAGNEVNRVSLPGDVDYAGKALVKAG